MTSHSSVVTAVAGRAVVLRGADIDTDRIMPARFLKAVTFDGLEQHLFADDRVAARAAGQVHPLDAATAPGSALLLTGANFGCGSSREHAPQGLLRWGVKAVVAESFSPIFAGNSMTIGLVCVAVEPDVLETLMRVTEAAPPTTFHVDLEARTISAPDGATWPVKLPDSQRHAWLSGEWDATSLLQADYADVEEVEARLPYLRTTSRKA